MDGWVELWLTSKVARDKAYSNAETVVLDNSSILVKLIPEKGSDVVEILDKSKGVNLLYRSPLPFRLFGSLSPPLGTDDSAFLDYYEGGWQDVLPNPGAASSYKGARWGLHGESALLPWGFELEETGEVSAVRLSTDLVRFPLRVDKRLSLREDEPVLRVEWEVENLGEEEVEFAWVQHIVFGRPVVGPGMRVDTRPTGCLAGDYGNSRIAPMSEFLWPRAPSREGPPIDLSLEPDGAKRFEDGVYLKMEEPWYALRNTKLGITVGVSWDSAVFPYLWYWLNNGVLGYPWWGRSYNLGLEPSSSPGEHGLRGYVERGNALHLRDGGSLKAHLSISLEHGAEPVTDVDGEGRIHTSRG